MKYKLYKNGNNDTSNMLKEVLVNREVYDYERYLNLQDDVMCSYHDLDNINKATELFMKHFNNKDIISILVDSDPDGYLSASMTYMYIKRLDSNYKVNYILHQRAKTHGLTDDITIPKDTKLLIIPDASTNDVEQCKKISENGIDILILDHHEKEVENNYAVIVNNQMSERYSNKDLCGAGVVYQFLKSLDDFTWNEYADDFLDLCAFANISDIMDLRSFETRYIVNMGLLNIKNKCLQALIKAQDYSMSGKVNPHNISWYITSVLNGMIRVGSNEEKELLFRAFIEQDEFFEYKKRATKDKPAEVIQESIYDRAVRLSKNAKSRQDKLREKSTAKIIKMAEQQSKDNKIVMVDVTEVLDSGLTGVVAIKIAEYFNKPCILVKRCFDKNLDKEVFSGSARNVNNSPIDSFKDIVNKTKILDGRGHSNAFGIVNFSVEDNDMAIEKFNELLKDIEYDSTYYVDFILDVNELTTGLIYDLSKFEDIVCHGVEEPKVAIENITLTRSEFEIFGKNEDTISFIINDIKYVMFKCKEGNKLYDFLQDAWCEDDEVTFNIVGQPSINEYNGVMTPQIVILDVEVISTDKNNVDDEW